MNLRSLGLGIAGASALLLASCGDDSGGTANVRPSASDTVVVVAVPAVGEDINLKDLSNDANGDKLKYYIDSLPAHGDLFDGGVGIGTTAVASAGVQVGSIVGYVPDAGFSGVDSFTFHVKDSSGANSRVATILIGVNNTGPDGTSQVPGPTILEDDPVTITLAATDINPTDSNFIFSIVTAPTNGTLSGITQLGNTAEVTYTPNPNWNSDEPGAAPPGPDSFTFSVSDGVDTGVAGDVEIAVTAVNDAPVGDPGQSAEVYVEPDYHLYTNLWLGAFTSDPVTFTLTATDPDLDDTVTFAVDDTGTDGILTLNSPATGSVTYEASGTSTTDDTFTFTVSDGALPSAPTTVSINIKYREQYVWGCGYNSNGALGRGTNLQAVNPVLLQVLRISRAVMADGWDHSLVLQMDHIAKAFGENSDGQLGDGTRTDRVSPIDSGLPSTISITAGQFHSGAAVWSPMMPSHHTGARMVGRNSQGQLGNNNAPTAAEYPVDVKDEFGQKMLDFIQIAAGSTFTIGLREDAGGVRTVWSWGANDKGQLGIGSIGAAGAPTFSPYPVQVLSGAGSPFVADVIQIDAGTAHAVVLTSTGAVYTWGDGQRGQLGFGLNNSRFYASYVGTGACQVAAGSEHTSSVWAGARQNVETWGSNTYGQHGDGTITSTIGWATLAGPVRDLASGGFHNIAVLDDGSVYGWGRNIYGQLGQDDEPPSNYEPLPVEIMRVPDPVSPVPFSNAAGEYGAVAAGAGYLHTLIIARMY